MPRIVWKQSEIEFSVPLRYGGMSFIEIAKLLTFEYFSELRLSPEALRACEVINQGRKRDTRLVVLMPSFREVLSEYGELSKVTESQLRDSVVMAQRLIFMAQTDRWRTYYEAYAVSEQASYTERVSK